MLCSCCRLRSAFSSRAAWAGDIARVCCRRWGLPLAGVWRLALGLLWDRRRRPTEERSKALRAAWHPPPAAVAAAAGVAPGADAGPAAPQFDAAAPPEPVGPEPAPAAPAGPASLQELLQALPGNPAAQAAGICAELAGEFAAEVLRLREHDLSILRNWLAAGEYKAAKGFMRRIVASSAS